MAISETYLIDNMQYMAGIPDKFFELAVVDPPYGINFGQYERGSSGVKVKERYTKNGKKKWDNQTPNDEYFKELFRVSKNQIIWGGNYFIQVAKIESPNLKTKEQFTEYINTSDQKWIFWYKQNPVPNFADGELAWISFNENRVFDLMYYGNINRDLVQIVPTQKPIALYKWILSNYAKPGDKIFDSHGGSMSSVIAALDMGFEIHCCESDPDYYYAAKKRIGNYLLQGDLFKEKPQIIFH